MVNDFLVQYFPNVIDFSFTAKVEEEFDHIATGKVDWTKMIKDFYNQFHPLVEDTSQIKRSEAVSAREIGIDPASGKMVYGKLGKYGAYVQIGEMEEEEKPKFASLRAGQLLENISLEDARGVV